MAQRAAAGSQGRIVINEPRLIITGPLALEVPDAARHFAALPEEDRLAELRRAVELGAHAIETMATSTTLRLVESEIAGMSDELSGQLRELLSKERGDSHTALRALLEDHRTNVTASLARYLDPDSQSSLPVALERLLDHGAQILGDRVEVLVSEGDNSALGRLAERLSAEIAKSTTTIVEQVAARHALMTKSALAGRPYEDALEERLLTLTRPLGDTVTRCADTMGQARRKAGDLLISLEPTAARGQDLRIVVEAKHRADGAQGFSENELRNALALARRNRGAHAGLFVVESPALLPLGIGFHELTSTDIAVTYGRDGDDVALAVALRLLRCALVLSVQGAGGDADRQRAKEVVGDIRQAMARLEGLKTQHQVAITSISKASTTAKDLEDDVLAGLRKLDDLF